MRQEITEGECAVCQMSYAPKRMTLHVEGGSPMNPGLDYLVSLCSWGCIITWCALKDGKGIPTEDERKTLPPTEYKPGDRVVICINQRRVFLEKELPADRIITLEPSPNPQGFRWGDFYIRRDEIECLAPEPPEPKTPEVDWKSGVLKNWSIIGMNHYHAGGEKFLFVSMGRGDRLIKHEGFDDADFWIVLKCKALDIDK